MVVRLQHFLEWTDGVEQAAIVFETSPGEDGGVLCVDETFVCEGAYVLTHRIDAHPRCCTDGFVAGPALVGASVRTSEQVGVHRKFTGG